MKMYDKLFLLQMTFSGKAQWHGKAYTTGIVNKGFGDHLEIKHRNEPDQFQWVLYHNHYKDKYHLMLLDTHDNCIHDQIFDDGIEAMQNLIALLKQEKYGFDK